MITIKEAILKEEKERIKEFLLSLSLNMPNELEKTFYIEEDSLIVATVSIDKNLIKCFGVDKLHQSQNIAAVLITEAIRYLRSKNITEYFVFTKKEYCSIFEFFGMREIVSTLKVSFLEGGSANINEVIAKMRKDIAQKFGDFAFNKRIASVVINANPITLGHEYLVEKALEENDYVVVFLLEEDASFYSFKERMSLTFLTFQRFDNVIIVPSSKYIVSLLTFPTYFLKEEEIAKECAYLDAQIFKEKFMPNLSIKRRYIGSEKKDYMVDYNSALKEALGDELVLVERFKDSDGIEVSASNVRKLVKEGKIIEASSFIPKQVRELFAIISSSK